MVTAPPELCAVCASPATITDWRPFEDWLAVEGCLCNGFFMSVRKRPVDPCSDRA
jgi:hypothetical protein